MKVAYVAGPYWAPATVGILANIRAAEAVEVALWRMGIVAVCPHKNSALLDGSLSDDPAADRAAWLAGDLEIMRRCDLVVVVPGWETSGGTLKEIAEAERLGIPVFYWLRDEDVLCAFGDPARLLEPTQDLGAAPDEAG